MFDKKTKKSEKKENLPRKNERNEDEELIEKEKLEAIKKLENAPPSPVMCNCIKQRLDPTEKNKACPYCGGLVG